MDLIQKLESEEIARLGKKIPEFKSGDTVVVNVNVVEGDRKRVQVVPQAFASSDEAMRYMVRHAVEIIESRVSPR